ncbi:MAG: hypothetical protein KME25_18245 [Symplocastrum torsivum CPER-KK1]|uniref:Uncharacterized protein n=1 Tax=Symplocastrum torsivum CPER-KK1 TaxID=450513 RepID=A0A951PNG4_9CYAN|nr:hypothetical protein [Symplocastrum torsivum CPER-KK1]
MTKEEFLMLSCRALEAKTGIGKTQWNNWFREENSPTLKTLRDTARIMKMPLIDFIEIFVARIEKAQQRQLIAQEATEPIKAAKEFSTKKEYRVVYRPYAVMRLVDVVEEDPGKAADH